MDVVVVGTGGLAREFAAFFSDEVNIVGFSSESSEEYSKFKLPDKFFEGDITPELVGTRYAVLAIGSPITKEAVSKKLESAGFVFPNLAHSSSVLATDIQELPDQGLIVSPNCVVGSDVSFGRHVYLNFMVGVGHDATFDDFVQINPGAQVGGAVSVGSRVLIGSGSSILQGLKVRDSSTVGSGAVVFSSVRPGVTVVGNPAKRLKLPGFTD
ncbi:acetyltransferase [Aurantiacibacter flavus]|uniref:Acetyltransferase n=1 Tax=Aurantiacibacter flavus TaxID=3145232 RepID=A0ABV0CYL5_9SPHN